MRHPSVSLFVVSAALVLAACSDGTGPEQPSDLTDIIAGSVAAGAIPGSDSTRACPDGGSIERSGSYTPEQDGDLLTITSLGSTRYLDCSREIEPGIVLVTNGSMEGQAVQTWNTGGDARTLLSFDATQRGSLRVTGPGLDRTCVTDLRIVYVPSTHSLRTTGSLCGETVDQTMPLPTFP